MLNSIEVFSDQARRSLDLPIDQDVDNTLTMEYFVLDVVGLDPVKANITTTEYALEDGVYLQMSRLEERNIVLTLGMNPDYAERTVQYLREKLYQYFMPGVGLRLVFHDSSYVSREIRGVVEDLEFPIFTSDPMASISILCPDPHFSSVEILDQTYQSTPQNDWAGLNYNGTSPAGVVVELTPDTDITGIRFEIQNESGRVEALSYSPTIPSGTTLRIDTRRGQRSLLAVQGSNKHNMLHGVSGSSLWPMLHPGENLIRLYSVSTPQDYLMSYSVKFGGL